MKPLIQKLPLSERSSFVARLYTTPLFETTWHQHDAYELVLQLDTKGMCFVGNHIGEFNAGDIFLIGANLPHEFKKEKEQLICNALVVHFSPELWGKEFTALPEFAEIKQLLSLSAQGIRFRNTSNEALRTALQQLQHASGFERFTLLCQCLLLMSRTRAKSTLSTITAFNSMAESKINKVFEYTILNFRSPIQLTTIADIANLSVAAFCRYFKRHTKKTYIEFVNEMRIGHACQALIDTEQSILQIGYECGFNTVANFNKQFLKIKGMKPSVYRNQLK